jgi:hypothetical protein
MAKRFFKLLYVLALIGIAISLPVYVLSSIRFDQIVISSYKAKCLSNGEYIVMQGSKPGEPYIFDEISLNDSIYLNTKKDLNFYCKYFDSVQPHIMAYANSKTRFEQMAANVSYFNFKDSVISGVYSYPPAYKLELVSNETRWYELYSPFVDWFVGAAVAFLVLQVLKICYVYVVFGELVWHPFKSKKR